MTPPHPGGPGRGGRHVGPALALALGLLASLGVAGCGSSDSPQTAADSAQQQQEQEHQAQAQGGVDRHTVTALGGSQVTIPARDRVTVAYFFAPGCPTCLPPAKDVAQAQRQTGQAQFVAINLAPDTPASELRSFLGRAGATQVPVVHNGQQLARVHQATGLNTTVVYTPDGQEAFRGVEASADAITQAVQEARP